MALLVLILFVCAVNVGGSEEEIKVKLGEDATFDIQLPTDLSGDVKLLEWSKPDLKSQNYVFFFRENRSYENYQDPHFHGRVELRDPQMKDGKVSVILKNVNINDSATYECHVSVTKRHERPTLDFTITFNLVVENSGGAAGRTGGGGKKQGHVGLIVGLSLIIVHVMVVVGFMIYRSKKQDHQPPADETTDHKLQDLAPEPKEKVKEEEEEEETPVET